MWSDGFGHRLKGTYSKIQNAEEEIAIYIPEFYDVTFEKPSENSEYVLKYSPRTELIQKLYPGSTRWL
jgi:hypothetical protein